MQRDGGKTEGGEGCVESRPGRKLIPITKMMALQDIMILYGFLNFHLTYNV